MLLVQSNVRRLWCTLPAELGYCNSLKLFPDIDIFFSLMKACKHLHRKLIFFTFLLFCAYFDLEQSNHSR